MVTDKDNPIDIHFEKGRYYKLGKDIYIFSIMTFGLESIPNKDYKALFKLTSKKFDWGDIEFLNDAGDIPEGYGDYPKEKGDKIIQKIAMLRELCR
jgi:hypothetical protein